MGGAVNVYAAQQSHRWGPAPPPLSSSSGVAVTVGLILPTRAENKDTVGLRHTQAPDPIIKQREGNKVQFQLCDILEKTTGMVKCSRVQDGGSLW